MNKFIIGLTLGIILSGAAQSWAGIISHVVAYQMGKSAGKDESKPCVCPNEKTK